MAFLEFLRAEPQGSFGEQLMNGAVAALRWPATFQLLMLVLVANPSHTMASDECDLKCQMEQQGVVFGEPPPGLNRLFKDGDACGGASHIDKYRYEISNSGEALSKASLTLEASTNASTSGKGYQTSLSAKIWIEDIATVVNRELARHSRSGCDRLRFHNDAAARAIGDTILIGSHFTYEERGCTWGGSVTFFKKVIPVKLYLTPVFEISDSSILVGLEDKYEAVIVPLLGHVSGSAFKGELIKPFSVPYIDPAAYVELEKSVSVDQGEVFIDLKATTKPFKKSVACLLKQQASGELAKLAPKIGK